MMTTKEILMIVIPSSMTAAAVTVRGYFSWLVYKNVIRPNEEQDRVIAEQASTINTLQQTVRELQTSFDNFTVKDEERSHNLYRRIASLDRNLAKLEGFLEAKVMKDGKL